MLWWLYGTGVVALLAARAFGRTGRAPRRFVGFARAMVISAAVVGTWAWFMAAAARRDLAEAAGSTSSGLPDGIRAATSLLDAAAVMPALLLITTAILAVTRPARLPPAAVVAHRRPTS